MENVIQNPGLQHIKETILSNLNYESLQKCQIVNKSLEDFLGDPMFWLRKWRTQRGLSKENYDDWVKAIKLTRNTNVEANMKLYLEKVIKYGYVLDISCFIDSEAVEKSNEYTFERAIKEKKLGILQILAIKNPNSIDVPIFWIRSQLILLAEGNVDILKFLVTFTNDPNIPRHHEFARLLQTFINTGHF